MENAELIFVLGFTSHGHDRISAVQILKLALFNYFQKTQQLTFLFTSQIDILAVSAILMIISDFD